MNARAFAIRLRLLAACPPRWPSVLALLAILISGCTHTSISRQTRPEVNYVSVSKVSASIAALPTTELIDKLQDEQREGAGTHTTAFVGGFLPLDTPPRFGGGVIGSAAPHKSEVMVELVKRGAASVPALLEHLEDSRPTKLTIGGAEGFHFDATWFSDEYDYRYRSQKLQPQGVNTVEGLKPDRMFTTYTITVGDLCYVALGQIVNRRLMAARYQPSGCMVVNSPTQYPALARAAREDWHNLTQEGLKQSLLTDFSDPSAFWVSEAALQPLLFYFPETGQAAVGQLLEREVLDLNALYDFALGQLHSVPGSERQKLAADFRQLHGEQYWHGIYKILTRLCDDSSPESANERMSAMELRSDLFPEPVTGSVIASEMVDYGSQQRLVEQLAAFHWEGLDERLLSLFHRTIASTPLRVSGRIDQADLALSCAKRLLHKGHDAEFSRFFTDAIKQLKMDDEEAIAIQAQGQLPRGNAGYHIALCQRFDIYGGFLRQLESN